ncbi:hypothetical protein ACTHGU_01790 [Chitinophagaceae bacterium MMS25-I14]
MKAKIIGCLQTGYLDVLLGYEYGHLNGGVVHRFEVEHFPEDCRMPNTIIEITFGDDMEIVRIELAGSQSDRQHGML